MVTIGHVAVVIPARDEEDSILDCLESVAAARRRLPPWVSCRIIVVADRCTDRTVARASSGIDCDAGDVVLASLVGTAGASRRVGTESVLGRDVDVERLWIANTDADTVVGSDWLTTQLALARDQVIGVAGIVQLREDSWCDLVLLESFTRTYTLGPGTCHPHVHGANMGFRGDAYRAAGGWSSLATGEDHDLWNRLGVVGPVVSTTALVVSTSARTVGRAPDGFAADLVALNRVIEPVA